MFQRADGGPWKQQRRPSQCAMPVAGRKIEPRVGFHQLRHTWASLAVMNEMPLMVVARNLAMPTH